MRAACRPAGSQRPRGGEFGAGLPLLLVLAVCFGPVHAGDKTPAPDAHDVQLDGDQEPKSRWATPRYPGVRVFIDGAGEVFLDDEPATTELLHEAFSNLKTYSGVVWYHRENPSEEPQDKVADAVDEVIGILNGYRLAVELFEAGFPDPHLHWQMLDNPPPRFDAQSAPRETEQPKR